MADNDIVVSVKCICYNHAKYLRRALDSVLEQKTNFTYEVLIHDDASTDGSQEIIREYMDTYPGRIRAILQTENQYSQGKRPNDILHGLVRGKYFEYLECDDFWQDEYKLQKQVDALQAHPECVMCVHRTELYNAQGISKKQFVPQEQLPEGILPQDTIVEYIANTAQFHTTSRLIQTKAYTVVSQMPYYVNRKTVGDLPLILGLSQQGPFYYLPDAMTGYRMGSNGSYSERLGKDVDFLCDVRKELIKMWDTFATCHPQHKKTAQEQIARYTKEILVARLTHVTSRAEGRREYQKAHDEPYLSYYKQLSAIRKLRCWAFCKFPKSMSTLRKLKHWLQHEK